MATVFLLLDAFRCDYLSESGTPFLWNCAQEGEYYERVVQSFGFCERSEILSGLRGDETGFFTAIGFDPANSPYKQAKGLGGLHCLDLVALQLLKTLRSDIAGKIDGRIRRYVDNMFRRRGITMPSYRIPIPWLKHFALTEDLIDHRDRAAFPAPSLLTQLTAAGRSYFYDSFTALGFKSPYHSDQSRLDAVCQEVSSGNHDLYLIYIGTPDMVGHRYGPDSEQLTNALGDLDRSIGEFVGEAERQSPGNRYVFVGDHGMLRVTDTVDLEPDIRRVLRQLGLRAGRDVLYFLDSTMARFWLLTDRCGRLGERLQEIPAIVNHGSWMDAAIARQFHVPWPDRRYGDMLWAASPGVMLFPDFFHRLTRCQGMHGYDPQLTDSQGLCIHWGAGIAPKRISQIPLTEVHHVLKQSLSL